MDRTTHTLQPRRTHLHHECMDQGPCASSSGAGSVTTSFPVSPLVEHLEEKGMESRVSVEDRSCAVDDVFGVEVEESRAPRKLRQRSEHDRLHLPFLGVQCAWSAEM